MTTLNRFRVTWQGGNGLPGLSTFYSLTVGPSPDINSNLKTFFEAIKSLIPSAVTIVYPTVADQIDDTTGTLVGATTVAAQTNTTCTGGTSYEAPTGMYVRWSTGGIVAGHRVLGRTYIVPSVIGATTNGQPAAANITTLQNAATALVAATSGSFSIFSPPIKPTDPDVPPRVPRAGSSWQVQGAAVPNKFAVLRSRRD